MTLRIFDWMLLKYMGINMDKNLTMEEAFELYRSEGLTDKWLWSCARADILKSFIEEYGAKTGPGKVAQAMFDIIIELREVYFQKSANQLETDNKHLRDMLFSSHGGNFEHNLYGDDGERQCQTCGIDFVRDTVSDIDLKISLWIMKKYQASLEAPDKAC
jgi:hypothetical protein